MKCNLRVGDRFPLSWLCEDLKDEKGRQVRARTIGRRVWGKDIGRPQWLLESREGHLVLFSVVEGETREHARFTPPDGYDSPWHSECVYRAQQVAEWHEAQAFNATLDLLTIEREAVPA